MCVGVLVCVCVFLFFLVFSLRAKMSSLKKMKESPYKRMSDLKGFKIYDYVKIIKWSVHEMR